MHKRGSEAEQNAAVCMINPSDALIHPRPGVVSYFPARTQYAILVLSV